MQPNPRQSPLAITSTRAGPKAQGEAVAAVSGVSDVRVNLVWTPPWHQDLMSEEARLELGLL